MPRVFALIAGLTLLLGGPAPAGEEAKPPESKPGVFANGNWADAQQFTAKAALVVIGKVVDPGKVNGKGWSMQNRGNNQMASVDVQQELTLEVSEVLRGKCDAGKLTVRVQTVSYPLNSLYQMLNRMENGKWTHRQNIPATDFALAKDRTYLLFLSEAKTEKGKDKDTPDRQIAEPVAETSPAEDPDAQLLASVRAFCRTLADWSSPPKLPAEEEARIKGLVADLGSDDFDKREKAEADLRKVGARAKVQLEAAAKDKDPERSFRAGELLKAAEPVPGKTELPGGAAAAPKPEVMKERPKEKPRAEPVPAPAPVPGPLPMPPAAVD